MAIKVICDMCKGEIDGRSDNYRKIYFMFGNDDGVEEYDFCVDCFTSIKRSIIDNLGIKKEQEATMHKHICPRCKHEWWSGQEYEFTCPKCDGDIS